jgi:hypothetical protein
MAKRIVTLEYNIKGQRIEFKFNEFGDIESLKINGEDRSEDGEAIDAALAVVTEVGNNIQRDISEAFDELGRPHYNDDDRRRAARLEHEHEKIRRELEAGKS